MARTLHVGIDVGMKRNEVCFTDDDGKRIGRFRRFANNRIEAQELQKVILKLVHTGGFEAILIGTEATSVYDFHLVDFLASSTELAARNTQVFRLNAREVAKFKTIFPDAEKTDRRDALIIAERLVFGHLDKPYQVADARSALQRLTRYRFHLAKTITAEKNYFLAQLFLKFSSFNTLKPFSDTFGATSTSFIEEFLTPDEILETSPEKLVDFLIDKGKNRFPDPDKVAQLCRRVARESYRLTPKLNDSVQLVLTMSQRSLRALGASVKHVDKAIADEFAVFQTTLQTIPGIGPVYSAGIFAEIGHCERYATNAQVARHAGLAWKRRQSAEFEADVTPGLFGANRYLRYYLVEAANSVRRQLPDYADFYARKSKAARSHHHKRGILLTARKLVRLIFRLLRRGEVYRPPAAK